MEEESFRFFRELVYRHSGIHLSAKEAGVLESRLGRRVRDLGLANLAEYRALHEGASGSAEVPALLDAVTINYTFFFRESRQFQHLSAEVLPALLAHAEVAGGRIRGWSAGCSSGEEPYSVAVCFAEVAGDPDRYDFRILATDINRKVLRTASRGIYPVERLAAFPQEHYYKYLVRDRETPEGFLRLTEELRRLVVFRRFNILRDARPLRGQLDLIFCRNVMIYFDGLTRARLVRNFHRYLRHGGFLYIGESENLPEGGSGLERVGPGAFRKI